MIERSLSVARAPRIHDERIGPADAAPTEAATLEGWSRAIARLRAELGEAVFESWFARLELERVADGTAHLSVPTNFLKSWIQQQYRQRIVAALAREVPQIRDLSITVRVSRRAMPAAAPEPAPHPREPAAVPEPPRREPRDLVGSTLDRRLVFANFVVGKSNLLACNAAMKAANGGDDASYMNPLYLHSAVGLGKTHLLQAIAHASEAAGRRVIYLTAERFMYGFVLAIKAQTALAFKEKLRGIDTLIIDDVQFLQGKSVQQEFCHTLNALIDARRQVVVASDRAPGELDNLEERVRSRLGGGLSVRLEALDEELREKIVAARILDARRAQPGFDVAPEVVGLVARLVDTNGRDLDGAVNRLVAHATISGGPLSVEEAEIAIRDLVRAREPRRVKIEDIQKLVASHFNVQKADILSARRTANVVRPRQIAMYLAKVLTPRSLPEIGRRFGGRDHTTVLHAVRKIDKLAGADRALREEIEHLKRLLAD